MSIEIHHLCPACRGVGTEYDEGFTRSCYRCGGTGENTIDPPTKEEITDEEDSENL